MRVSICRTEKVEFSHFLPDHEGKCKNLHGHSGKLEIEVSGEVCKKGKEKGMVLDYQHLKELIQWLNLDHTFLNVTITNPTAENICGTIWKKAWTGLAKISQDLGRGLTLERVRFWETENSWAEIKKGE